MPRERNGRSGLPEPSTGPARHAGAASESARRTEAPAPAPPVESRPKPADNGAPDPAARVRDGALADYDFSNFYWGTGEDPFVILGPFREWYEYAHDWGYYQFGQPLQTAPATTIDIVEDKGRERLDGLINFSSYNYLGLSYRPEVIEAAQQAIGVYGLGASGSPILSGMFDQHERLAEEIAEFKGTEKVLLFPTGFSANLGVIAGLMRPGDTVIADQYAHASIVDGIVLSKARCRFFRHNDMNDLEKKLKRSEGKKLVVVEGVYSMDGDLADLPNVVKLCRQYGARLLVDEAHSAFLFGEHGRGVVEHFGLEGQVDIQMGTFSKSLGGIGGYIATNAALCTYLKAFARAYMFSCAMPPAIAAGLRTSLKLCRAEPELRERLWHNVALLQGLLRDAGLDIGNSQSQVIPIMVRDDQAIFGLAEELVHAGVFLQPIRFPAVTKHQSRFRISVSAAHSTEELERGAEIISNVLGGKTR